MADVHLTIPTFVGRAHELRELRQASAAVANGGDQTILIAGEAGFGKTRLVSEWLTTDSTLATRLQLDCEPDLLRPMALLERLARQLAHSEAADDASLQELQLALASSRFHDTEAGIGDLIVERSIEALLQAAERRPTLLFIEDLHWADPSLRSFVSRLVTRLARTGQDERRPTLLLAATYRPFEMPPDLLVAVDKAARPGRTVRLVLPGLDELETDALAMGMGLPRLTTKANRMLRDATAGNPFHLQVCLHSLLDQGRLAILSNSTDIVGHGIDAELTGDLVTAVNRRLQSLSNRSLDVLGHASLLTQPFSFEALLEATQGEASELAADLHHARAEHLIAGQPDSYRFTHPLLQAVLTRRLGPERAALIHARLATSLLADSTDAVQRLEVARHLLRAGPFASAAAMADVAIDASALAYRLGGYAESAEIAEAGLDAVTRLDGAARATIAELHLRSGAALHRAHEQERYGPHLNQAIELARADGAMAVWAEALEHRVRGDQTIRGLTVRPDELDELLTALGSDGRHGGLRSRMLQLRSEILFTAGAFDDGRGAAIDARSIARQIGDKDLEANAAVAEGLNEWATLDLQRARSSFETAHRLSMLEGERWASTWAQARLAMVHLNAGRIDAALTNARDCADRAASIGQWSDRALARAIEASALLHRGDIDDAERTALLCLAEVDRGEYERAAAIAAPLLACIHARRGDAAAADRALRRYAYGRRPPPGIFRLLAAVTGGDLIAARALVDPTRIPNGQITALTLPNLCGQADALGTLDIPAPEPVAVLLQQAWLAGGVLTLEWQLSVPRLLGQALRALGDVGSSVEVLETALTQLSVAGALPEVAFTHLELARSYDRLGGDNRPTALWHSEAAMELMERLGFQRALTVARREALNLGSQRAARSFPPEDSVVGPPIQGVFLMSDIVSSTSLSLRFKDEAWVRVMNEHDRRVAECLAQYGGTEFAHRGDGIAAYFPASGNGIRCAIAMHRSLAAVATPDGSGLRIRIGLSRDEARPRRVTDLCGRGIARVARIMSSAEHGGTVVGAELAGEAKQAGLHLSSAETIIPKGFEAEPFAIHHVANPHG